VIVSHYNSARTISRCISHLLCQDYPNDLTRIIIVDAGSTDGSTEIVRQFYAPTITQFVVEGSTEAEGQMFGVQKSDSEVLMFTNSDIYVPPSWISQHVAQLQRGYDLVGGRVFWGGDKFSLTWNMPAPKGPQFVQQQGMGLGFSNCSVRKDVLIRSGGIRNLVSQQDTDFAFRVVRSGGRMILDPSIEVYHDHPLKSFKACFNRSFAYARNHVLVMRVSYGRIVIGSGHPAMLSLGSLIKEWAAVNGVRVYFEDNKRARQENIRVTVLEFLYIRQFSTLLAKMVGVFVGAIKRRVTMNSIANIH
jgi:glycosyltransferase involved in cell wall biosynthesis